MCEWKINIIKKSILGIFPFSVLVFLNWKIYFSIKRLKASLRSLTPKRSITEHGRLVPYVLLFFPPL